MERLIKAIDFSARKHRMQRRKNYDKTPYINHPIEVMYLLSCTGVTDINTLIAAVLHDTIEDTGTTKEEITKEFGFDVTKIVLECTDDKSLDKVTRKKLQIEHVKKASKEAKNIKLADKYSNICDLLSNPPSGWSKEEIYGYAYWSWSVCRGARGVNKKLENKLDVLFADFDIKEDKLDDELDKYYKKIGK